MYSIKTIAEKTGKTSRAIRYYEQLGILSPDSRTEAGYRMYSDKSVLQVEWIDKLNRLGFSLPEIKKFLSSFGSVESASDLMNQMSALYQEKLLEVHQQIAQLQQLATELQESIQFANQCTPCQFRVGQSDCPNCTRHGHNQTQIPILIAGVQESLQHSHD